MKILAFSDFHDSKKSYRRARDLVRKEAPAVVVIAGDLTNRGSPAEVQVFIDILEFNNIFYVWGNMDGFAPEMKISPMMKNLHLNLEILEDITFVGLAGKRSTVTANLAPFEQLLKEEKSNCIVLVSHIPPYGHCDLAYNGSHIGSKDLLYLVQEYQPLLVISGHVHENRTNSVEGSTAIWNVGPTGVLFDIENGRLRAKRIE